MHATNAARKVVSITAIVFVNGDGGVPQKPKRR
jgi:hypothetical protein